MSHISQDRKKATLNNGELDDICINAESMQNYKINVDEDFDQSINMTFKIHEIGLKGMSIVALSVWKNSFKNQTHSLETKLRSDGKLTNSKIISNFLNVFMKT